MIWVIIGLISFIIQIYVLKHTYTVTVKGLTDFNWEKAEKISGIPLWIMLIMLITSAIPIANIVELIIFWIIWLKYYSEDPDRCNSNIQYTYWRFKDKFFSRKI